MSNTTTSKNTLHIIQRLNDLMRDPEVPTAPRKELAVPEIYEGLTEQLRQFVHVGGEVVRFSPLENAGYQPFWNNGVLKLRTPKGVITLH